MRADLAGLLISLGIAIGYVIGSVRGLRAGWRDAETVWGPLRNEAARDD